MLNMSAVNSRFTRSPIGMRFETRRSLNTVHGVTPALRPRLPSSCRRVGGTPLSKNSATHGACRTLVGENFDFAMAPQAGLVVVFGLPVNDDSWRLSPLPVMMLNGRPELNSISGAKVQSLRKALANPLPLTCPV